MGVTWLARVVVIACVVVITAPDARANDKLVGKARAQLDESEFAKARITLERALASGENGRVELAEIYQMLGTALAALGETNAATRAFQRMLALSPSETLPDGTSPKITQPFDKAKAYITSKRPLETKVETSSNPWSVTIVVPSDPLGMITSAQVWFSADGGPEQTLKVSSLPPLTIPLPTARKMVLRVAALDLYGNKLLDIRGLELGRGLPETTTTSTTTTGDAAPSITKRGPAGPPLYTRWWLWGGTAVAFALGGAYFGTQMQSDRDAHDALLADSANHRYQEAYDLEQSMRSNALLANLSFGIAGVAALASIYCIATGAGRSEQPKVAPAVTGDGAGVTFVTRF